MSERIRITCRDSQSIMVDSPFKVAGLAVTPYIAHPLVVDSTCWRVTHIASGLSLPGFFDTVANASKALRAYLPLADWQKPSDDPEYTESLGRQVALIARRIRLWDYDV